MTLTSYHQHRGPKVVCSGLIQREGKFLLTKCPSFKVWRLPGGRPEFDETSLEESFLREMKEELGVELKHPKFLGFGQDQQFHFRFNEKTSRVVMIFYAELSKGQELIIDPTEATDSKWVNLADLKAETEKEAAIDDFFRRNPHLSLSSM
ncbi:NUDIX hydrolase [bacterium]|nr:NUDIX hydrolase [bacterium]